MFASRNDADIQKKGPEWNSYEEEMGSEFVPLVPPITIKPLNELMMLVDRHNYQELI